MPLLSWVINLQLDDGFLAGVHVPNVNFSVIAVPRLMYTRNNLVVRVLWDFIQVAMKHPEGHLALRYPYMGMNHFTIQYHIYHPYFVGMNIHKSQRCLC